MRLKTFRAHSMADALAAVKTDLGRDAVILHTRTVKIGGLLGFGRRTLFEVTASDEAPGPRRRPPAAVPGGARGGNDTAASAVRNGAATVGGGGAMRAAAVYRRAAAAAEVTTGSEPDVATPPPVPAPRASKGVPAVPAVVVEPAGASPASGEKMQVRQRRAAAGGASETDPGGSTGRAEPVSAATGPAGSILLPDTSADIRAELCQIKLLVNQVLQSSSSILGPGTAGVAAGGVAAGTLAIGSTPDALFAHYLKLLESQVARDVADRIVAAVRGELTAAELTDETIVRETVVRHLAGMMQVAETATPARLKPGTGPMVIALVGPTGVGKTTTIAKLAAAYKLRQGRSVALITADTYRIAAVDQLRTYAGIIGLPLRVVLTPGEMEAAIEALAGYDVILVDTAGRSQHNTERIDELAQFLAAAKPHETHLVLSTTAAPEVLMSAAEAFSAVRPNRLILTKLDEAVHFGVVVNVMSRLTTQLSFLTTGQEVPDHIVPARAERLARMILTGRSADVTGDGAAIRDGRNQSPLFEGRS